MPISVSGIFLRIDFGASISGSFWFSSDRTRKSKWQLPQGPAGQTLSGLVLQALRIAYCDQVLQPWILSVTLPTLNYVFLHILNLYRKRPQRKKKYEGGERSCLFKPIWGHFCLVEQAKRMMFTFDNTCFSSLPAPRLLFWHPCKHAILRQYWASTGLVMNHNGMCTVVRCYLISYLVQKYLLTCCDWY